VYCIDGLKLLPSFDNWNAPVEQGDTSPERYANKCKCFICRRTMATKGNCTSVVKTVSEGGGGTGELVQAYII
jgi:hypothetical protein